MINNHFLKYLGLFIGLNILLYLFIYFFHDRVPFNYHNYEKNAHHYFPDPQYENGQFDLLRSLGQYDAQWYLKIAETGYPTFPHITYQNDKSQMEGLSYAFFPLYPIIVSFLNIFFSDIEISAFVFSNLLLIANFISIYIAISKIYSSNLAVKTAFLLLLSPLSIFFRSYFSEGLFLFLFIWFTYFLIKNKWILASIALSLLLLVKPNALFLGFPFIYILFKNFQYTKTHIVKIILSVVLPFLAFSSWLIFCFFKTGDPFYFISIRSSWFSSDSIFSPFINNIRQILLFPSLKFHYFHSSQIDILFALTTGIIIILSRKKLNYIFWLTTAVLFIGPLLTTDFMSFSRYQIVSFPLFLFLAQKLKNTTYYLIVLELFIVGLFWLSLYFVNWHWIG